MVAPITSTVRNMRLEVILLETLETSGFNLVHQLKSLDFADREAARIEITPLAITQKVLSLAKAIISQTPNLCVLGLVDLE